MYDSTFVRLKQINNAIAHYVNFRLFTTKAAHNKADGNMVQTLQTIMHVVYVS